MARQLYTSKLNKKKPKKKKVKKIVKKVIVKKTKYIPKYNYNDARWVNGWLSHLNYIPFLLLVGSTDGYLI